MMNCQISESSTVVEDCPLVLDDAIPQHHFYRLWPTRWLQYLKEWVALFIIQPSAAWTKLLPWFKAFSKPLYANFRLPIDPGHFKIRINGDNLEVPLESAFPSRLGNLLANHLHPVKIPHFREIDLPTSPIVWERRWCQLHSMPRVFAREVETLWLVLHRQLHAGNKGWSSSETVLAKAPFSQSELCLLCGWENESWTHLFCDCLTVYQVYPVAE